MDASDSIMDLPTSAKTLIPHRSPVCMVDRLLEAGENSGVVESVILKDSFLLDEDNNLDPAGMIELIAQACAAVKGYNDRLNNRPVQQGHLVAIRGFKSEGRAHAGDRLLIRIAVNSVYESFVAADGEVIRGEDVIASGSIRLQIMV